MTKLLPRFWTRGHTVFYLVFVVVLYLFGWLHASAVWGLKLKKQENHYLTEKKTQFENYLTLQKQFTDELAQKNNEIEKQRYELTQKIDEKITADGPAYTGIGTNGLQLYKRALGYPRRLTCQ